MFHVFVDKGCKQRLRILLFCFFPVVHIIEHNRREVTCQFYYVFFVILRTVTYLYTLISTNLKQDRMPLVSLLCIAINLYSIGIASGLVNVCGHIA